MSEHTCERCAELERARDAAVRQLQDALEDSRELLDEVRRLRAENDRWYCPVCRRSSPAERPVWYGCCFVNATLREAAVVAAARTTTT